MLIGRKAEKLTNLQHPAQGRCTQHRGVGLKTKLIINFKNFITIITFIKQCIFISIFETENH